MEIRNSFRIALPRRDAWRLLLDVERIAPCLPGAVLESRDGGVYRGRVAVKVGPITARYTGTATIENADEEAGTFVVAAEGREVRGQGTAGAKVAVTLREDGDGTAVDLATDLAVTGRAAQFGRGVMDDVSARLLDRFAENLAKETAEPDPGPDPGPEVVPADSAGDDEIDLFGALTGTRTARRARAAGIAAGVLVVLGLAWHSRRKRR